MSSKAAKRNRFFGCRQPVEIAETAAGKSDARSAYLLSGVGGMDASHKSARAGGRFKMNNH